MRTASGSHCPPRQVRPSTDAKPRAAAPRLPRGSVAESGLIEAVGETARRPASTSRRRPARLRLSHRCPRRRLLTCRYPRALGRAEASTRLRADTACTAATSGAADGMVARHRRRAVIRRHVVSRYLRARAARHVPPAAMADRARRDEPGDKVILTDDRVTHERGSCTPGDPEQPTQTIGTAWLTRRCCRLAGLRGSFEEWTDLDRSTGDQEAHTVGTCDGSALRAPPGRTDTVEQAQSSEWGAYRTWPKAGFAVFGADETDARWSLRPTRRALRPSSNGATAFPGDGGTIIWRRTAGVFRTAVVTGSSGPGVSHTGRAGSTQYCGRHGRGLPTWSSDEAARCAKGVAVSGTFRGKEGPRRWYDWTRGRPGLGGQPASPRFLPAYGTTYWCTQDRTRVILRQTGHVRGATYAPPETPPPLLRPHPTPAPATPSLAQSGALVGLWYASAHPNEPRHPEAHTHCTATPCAHRRSGTSTLDTGSDTIHSPPPAKEPC